jgi:ankyrin repeat protein
MQSRPQSAPDGHEAPSCGADYGLMKRTSELRNAVEAGDAALAAEVIDCLNLQKSAGFTIQDVSGNGLLQISALQNKPRMVSNLPPKLWRKTKNLATDCNTQTNVLLDKGFGINDIDSNHGTALQAAIYMDHLDVIDVLLSPGRSVKADVNTAGGYYGCALQVAAFKGSASLIQRLLDLGADVNTCGGKYSSVLQAAARTGLPSILKLILGAKPQTRGIDVNCEGGVYGTALQAAAKGDYTGQTRYLRRLSRGRVLKQPTTVPRTTSKEKPDYLEVANVLIANGAIVKCDGGRLGSPIGAAASSGKFNMLSLLVKYDKTPPDKRRQPYSCALINAITQTFVEDRLPLVKLLVKEGADVNFETGSGLHNRPLTAAAAMNSVAVIEYLLKKVPGMRATINTESGIYGSALRAALSAEAQRAALYLIEQGAEINTTKDEVYGNVLHLAVFSKMDEVVELLLREYDVPVNLRDDAGQSALHIAAYRGYKGTVSTLLQYGADPDLKDAWGDTPRKIVEDVIERESHPGPSLEDLRKIKQQLLEASARQNKRKPDDLVHGPPTTKKAQASQPEQGTAKPVFSSPIWNPGLGFKATIVDFLQKDGDEYLSIKSLSMDDLLYRKNAVAELMLLKDPGYERNLRWYHIPSNNMTWDEMLMKILWAEKHPKTTCKSFWGTDPYFVSPDLAPHARFITPQCERLIPDTFEGSEPPPEITQSAQNTMFLAMPYLHWESYRSAEAVSDLLDEIKEESLKTRILRGGKTWRTHEANPKPLLAHSKPLNSAIAPENSTVRITNDKIPDADDVLLEKYLFKRWPIHLRRTLDQYYYSYLADTRARDGDQVVMRVRNEELYRNELAINGRYHVHTHGPETVEKQTKNGNYLRKIIHKRFNTNKEVPPEGLRAKKPPKDKNSPIVMVDQLWLWVLDRGGLLSALLFRARQD